MTATVLPFARPSKNPWRLEAPPCPHCGEVAHLWADGPLRWFCVPCKRRFDDEPSES